MGSESEGSETSHLLKSGDQDFDEIVENLAKANLPFSVKIPVTVRQARNKQVRPITTASSGATPPAPRTSSGPVFDAYGVQLLQGTPKPAFSGRSRDWQNFVRDFEEYLNLVKQVVPQELSNEVLLHTLQGCLN